RLRSKTPDRVARVPARVDQVERGPRSTIASLARCAHAIQVSMPAWACVASLWLICSDADSFARGKTVVRARRRSSSSGRGRTCAAELGQEPGQCLVAVNAFAAPAGRD